MAYDLLPIAGDLKGWRLRLAVVDEALAELAGYFRRQAAVSAGELVQLAAAARAAGSRWNVIAAVCGIRDYRDITGIAALPCWTGSDTGADLLFSAVQHAVHHMTGSRGLFAPLSWPCPDCRQQVTDRAFAGRPVHIEHGHAPGCPRLARDQAADDIERRGRVPGLIVYSEDPSGPVQRHWLAERIEDDCPRCGWRGYFHHYIVTIDDDWAGGICDDCYADLHPAITVTVRYFSACSPLDGEPVAVIRQRTRSDYPYPDLGQVLTWRLSWKHTPMLIDDRRGNCDEDITPVSREQAEQIAAGLATRYWPPDAARLPWVASAYPE